MTELVLKRLASAVAVLLVLSMIMFLIQYVLPADPARAQLGTKATDREVEAKRQELGLDKPITTQYWEFLKRLSHGDLGTSQASDRPVASEILKLAPATLELVIAGFIVSCVLGLLFGLWCAGNWRGTGPARVVILSLASMPSYFVALALVVIFGVKLHLLPVNGAIAPVYNRAGPTYAPVLDSLIHLDMGAFWSSLVHLIIPVVAVALGPAAAIARALRTTLGAVLAEDYVRAARAKGLSERRVILRHGLRNAISPVLSIAGLQLGGMLAGVVVVETIVNWPGLGHYAANAIELLDFPALMGTVFVIGAAFILINLMVDVLQLITDPRVRAAAMVKRRARVKVEGA